MNEIDASAMQTLNSLTTLLGQAEQELANGRLQQAVSLYEAAVRHAPDHAPTRHDLGLVYLNIGNFAEALSHLDAACRLAPKESMYRLRRGVALQKMGRVQEALQDYEFRLSIVPGDGTAWSNVAAARMTLGDLDAALQAARTSVANAPTLAIAWNNLGQVLYQKGEFDQAEPCLRKALALQPNLADACCNLADVLRALYRDIEAEQWYGQALQLAPQHAAAYINLANMLVSNGRNDEAIDLYKKVLHFEPQHAEALDNLCSALIEAGREKEAEALLAPRTSDPESPPFRFALYARALMLLGNKAEAVEVLEPHLSSLHPAVLETWAVLSEGDQLRMQRTIQLLEEWIKTQEKNAAIPLRVSMRLNMAAQLEKIGEYGKAFIVARDAKALIPRREDPLTLKQQLHFLKLAFNERRLAQPPYGLTDENRPVFVLGMPRSGTSLIEQMLGLSPEVYPAGELEEFNRISSEFGAPFDLKWMERLSGLDAFSLQTLAERWLSVAAPRHGSPRFIIDKMPHNFVMIGLISILFPQAKIVHVQRDPRDVCLSIFFSNFTGHHPYQNNIEDIARHYIFYHELMQFWKKASPIRIYEIRYEELVINPELEGRKLFEYLDLSWSQEYVQIHRSSRAVLTTSRMQVKKPIYQSSIGRWKNFRKELLPAINILTPILENIN